MAVTFLCIKYKKPKATHLVLKRRFWSRYPLFKKTKKTAPPIFESGKMINWLKRLFKKEKKIGFIEIEITEVKPVIKYNTRDKKGRFVKKGKSNGKRR